MVIHNLAEAAQEDVLNSWSIVAHYQEFSEKISSPIEVDTGRTLLFVLIL